MKKDHFTNIFKVCVNSINEYRISGFVYGLQLNEPIPFYDLGNLLLTLDGIMDCINFPQSFQQKREFDCKKIAKTSIDGSKPLTEKDVYDSAIGSHATIAISVITRQNTTWQGFVDFNDGLPRKSFSSAMELIRQIDTYLFGQK
ncbi:MAG: hypothetical protein ACOX4U_08555 [Anaerovoracaceae bacterium]|jgi:hypothetical protein